jgi:hypothetical protein
MKFIKFDNVLTGIIHPDPIKKCELYKHKGCSFVDGMLCNVNTCEELKDYRKELNRFKKIIKIKNVLYNTRKSI